MKWISSLSRAQFAVIATAGLAIPFAVAGSAAEEPASYVGGAAPELTSGRPGRGTARSVAGPPSAKGFVEFGALEDTTKSITPNDRNVELTANGAGVRLNFVNVDLQEFARAVFDEVLQENVIVDPGVTGRITVRTSTAVPKAAAVSLVREALQSSGAMLSRPAGVWRIGPAPRNAGGSREMVRVVPLRYISVADAKQALQSFAGGNGADVAVNGTGRFLMLAGRSVDVENLEQVVASFDVDELKGRSFALVPLKQAGASAVARDLSQMVGVEGPAQGVRVFPIERMNAVMVAARDPGMIERTRRWIDGLDQSGQDQRRVYVFPVRNRRAADLAKVLDGMLQGRARVDTGTEGSPIAPGLAPQQSVLSAANQGRRGMLASADPQALPVAAREEVGGGSPSASSGQGGRDTQGGVEVRADISTNTLLIVARPEEYRIVDSAIRNLDVLPTQVLIEATIAEVRLNESLKHGVRWYFQNGVHGFGSGDGTALGGREARAGAAGFTYSFGIPSAKIAISALESVTDVEIVSSPALTVLDNQVATLKVGDQVPIATRSAQSVLTPDAPVVNDIQLKDTGIILQVTPRVSAGGLIMLDIAQEASDVVPTTTSYINSPTIRQRQVTSTIAVKSGAEIVLGGIIQRSNQREHDGLPILKNIPLLGEVFTSNAGYDRGRTELVIIIRPTIMANHAEVRAVTDEVKRRMRGAAVAPQPAVRARY